MHLLNKARDSNNDIGVCTGNQCEPKALASDARLEIVEVGVFFYSLLCMLSLVISAPPTCSSNLLFAWDSQSGEVSYKEKEFGKVCSRDMMN